MKCRTSSINDSDEENLDGSVLRNEIRALLNKTRGGEFSTGTLGKFYPALTGLMVQATPFCFAPRTALRRECFLKNVDRVH
jgi:hypothetical protein